VPEYHIIQSDVSVSLADHSDRDQILVGVVVDDAFVPFGAIAKGVYDEQIREQQQAAAEAKAASKSSSKSG
jgi:hypothetical protein